MNTPTDSDLPQDATATSASHATPLAAELDQLRQKCAQLEKQASDYKSLIADFENSRKRLAQDAERERKYQGERIFRDLLPVMDNLDFAVRAAEQVQETSQIFAGVKATLQQGLEMLKRHGVQPIEAAPGTRFDPNLHQAVMEQPTNDVPAGHVVAVVQMGFLYHDRVLRAASVVTAIEPPAGGGQD